MGHLKEWGQPWGGSATVTSISPAIGFSFGKTPVTIRGTGFTGTPVVKVGGVLCTSVVVVNATTITAVTGAKARSTNQSVTVDSGTLTNAFEYADPANPPGGSAVGVCWLNSQNVTLIAGPKASAAADMTGNGRNAACQATFEIPYNAADASYNGFPSFNNSNAGSGGALAYTNPLAAVAFSCAMVGFGDPTAAQNYWWNCAGIEQLVILPAPKNITCRSNNPGALLAWSNAVDGITKPGVFTAGFDGTVAATLRVNSLTAVTGDAGTLVNESGQLMNVGTRGQSNTTQSINGTWTDFIQYNGKLSASDAQYVQRVFGAIYGITINP